MLSCRNRIKTLKIFLVWKKARTTILDYSHPYLWNPTLLSAETSYKKAMATTSFTSPSLISLATIIVCTVVALSYAGPAVSPSPATTSKAIVRREADLTSEQIRSVVEVKIGVSVMKRLVVSCWLKSSQQRNAFRSVIHSLSLSIHMACTHSISFKSIDRIDRWLSYRYSGYQLGEATQWALRNKHHTSREGNDRIHHASAVHLDVQCSRNTGIQLYQPGAVQSSHWTDTQWCLQLGEWNMIVHAYTTSKWSLLNDRTVLHTASACFMHNSERDW